MGSSWEHAIAGLLLCGMRVSGLLVFAPVLGDFTVPPRVKAGLAIALTWVVYPLHAPRVDVPELTMAAMLASEAVLGLATGLVVQFVFEAVQVAGQIFGFQMGFSLVNV